MSGTALTICPWLYLVDLLVVVSLSGGRIKSKPRNTHANSFLIPLPLPGCLPEVSGTKSNFYVLRTHKSHRLNLIPMCHKWEVLNLKVHVLAGSLISCGRGLYAVGGSDIDSPSLCEFLKTCWKRSPDHSGLNICKAVSLWCGEWMGGASVTALNKGLARAWWVWAGWWDYLHCSSVQGPGVIKNTNPLINFKSARIEKGIVNNNARVFCRPLGFATLISPYSQETIFTSVSEMSW